MFKTLASAVCSYCGKGFLRRPVDLRRAEKPVCSIKCRSDASRTGRAKAPVVCAGCGVEFLKDLAEINRKTRQANRHFCSHDCYMRVVDFRAIGRLGSLTQKKNIDPEVKFRRSQLGGFKRAANLSAEEKKRIAMLGVEARRKMTPVQKAEAKVRQRAGYTVVLGVRIGRR
jgi:hypothetical protein